MTLDAFRRLANLGKRERAPALMRGIQGLTNGQSLAPMKLCVTARPEQPQNKPDWHHDDRAGDNILASLAHRVKAHFRYALSETLRRLNNLERLNVQP